MSTSRLRHKLWGLVPNTVEVAGSFAPQGTSAPSISEGKGFSVSRTGVGTFRVTLDDTYPGLIDAVCGLRTADSTLSTIQMGDYNSSNKTIDFRVFVNSGQSNTAGLGFIPVPLASTRELSSNAIINAAGNGGILASDSTPILNAINAGTDQQLRLTWAAGNTDKVTWSTPLPPDLDDAADMTVHFITGMAGATDTPTITIEAFFGVGDTDAGGATAALSDTIAERTVTLDAADVTAYPDRLTVTATPGTHANDALYIDAVWLTYQRSATSNTSLVLADLSADADNVVNFNLLMRNSSLGA